MTVEQAGKWMFHISMFILVLSMSALIGGIAANLWMDVFR